MILAIDIGGTKTLLVLARNDGQILSRFKFLSPKSYKEFIKTLRDNISEFIKNKNISIVSIGCAGSIDRSNGVITYSPNLNWNEVPLGKDISKIFNNIPVLIENDANLAGLSEAHLLNDINQKVLYITFSTGIGTGFIANGKLDPELLDSEGGHMVFEHEGKLMDWESFSAGRMITKKYGKMASELDSARAWKEIAHNMAIGIINNNAVFQGNTVIIGGSVGTYFQKYGKYLQKEVDIMLKEAEMVTRPKIIGAKNAEEAVILGCVINAKQYEQH